MNNADKEYEKANDAWEELEKVLKGYKKAKEEK